MNFKIKNMKLLTTSITIALCLFFHFSFGQLSRKVYLNKNDTTVEATVLNSEKIKANVKQEKWYYWFKNNEINKNFGGYSGYLLHGKFLVFVNHKMIAKGYFYKGLKDNNWYYWNESGELYKKEKWRKGKLLYLTNYLRDSVGNKLISTVSMKNGKKNGKETIKSNNHIIKKQYWKNGELKKTLPNKKHQECDNENKKNKEVSKDNKEPRRANKKKLNWFKFKTQKEKEILKE